MSDRTFIHSLLVAVLLLCGCRATPLPEINQRYRQVLLQRETQYRLKPGDVITLRFYNQDMELNQTLLVLPDGRTDPFFMDDAQVAGKTIPELQEEIRRHYADQINQSEISMQVAPAGETVTVEGEVIRPSIQPYAIKMTLLQALGNSGGYKLTAHLRGVIVRRYFLDPRKPDVFRVNVNAYAHTPEDLVLLPSDQIVVERTFLILIRDYIDEYVWGFLPPFFRSIPIAALGL
jgi:protein involved in polysaccharide export with SLBB domain